MPTQDGDFFRFLWAAWLIVWIIVGLLQLHERLA